MRIALTGLIASGKSSVSAQLANLGAKIIDYDLISHNLARDPYVLSEIRENWGAKVFHSDTTLNRAALGEIVFQDKTQLKLLNAIMHPRIEEIAREQEQELLDAEYFEDAEYPEGAKSALIVHDIPLFIGSWIQNEADLAIGIFSNLEIRIKRMVEFRKMTFAEAQARIANQDLESQLRNVVDVVVNNNHSIAELELNIRQLWEDILKGKPEIEYGRK